MKNNLQHIAIIMDGNGRWARKRNLPTALGHTEGAKTAKRIIKSCLKLEIPYLTLYTFSSENWFRDPEEVEGLMSLLKFYLVYELELLTSNQIKVTFIGDKSKLPLEILLLIKNCEELTKDFKKLNLQIAISYGSRQEILNAQKTLFSDLISDKLKIEELNEELFKSYLYTASVPDPDLLIRTSGEYRISNFLLWQIAYSELYFTKVLWPDFTLTHLRHAIKSFNKRERRYGLSKQIV